MVHLEVSCLLGIVAAPMELGVALRYARTGARRRIEVAIAAQKRHPRTGKKESTLMQDLAKCTLCDNTERGRPGQSRNVKVLFGDFNGKMLGLQIWLSQLKPPRP